METSEFVVELRKMEEKYKVMENSYAMFQTREAVSCWQILFKIGILKKISQISQEKSCVRVPF